MRNLSTGLGGSVLDADEIKNYLQTPEAVKLYRRIMDGSEITWNGSNHVGNMNDDATAALDELSEELQGFYADIEVWDIETYLYDYCTAEMTDKEIEEKAREINSDNSVIVLDSDVDDLIQYMKARRAELRRDAD